MNLNVNMSECVKAGIGLYIGWTIASDLHKRLKKLIIDREITL